MSSGSPSSFVVSRIIGTTTSSGGTTLSSLMLPPSSLSPGAGLRAGTPCPVRLPCARRLPCVGVAVSAGLIDGREEIVKADLDAVMLLIERSALDGPVSVQNLPHHVGREQVVRTIQGPPPVRARPAFGVVLAHRPSSAVSMARTVAHG